MPYYLNPSNVGISLVTAKGNGSTIILKWHRAFPSKKTNLMAYNIYMDTVLPDFEHRFFNKSPAFVSVNGKLTVDIEDLVPGQMYRFGVRPVEYDVNTFDLKDLPETFNELRIYPESPLAADISASSNIIPLLSVEDFPSSGTVKIGAELIQYSSVDLLNNELILTNAALQRGFNGTEATYHLTTGYDGYTYWDNAVLFFPIDVEDRNTVVYATQDRFDYPNYAFNLVDGYRQTTKDVVNTDYSVNDAANAGFPAFSYSGYYRTDPVALLNGECVGLYFGGEIGCIDGYGNDMRLRGISVQDINNQRQEVLLDLIGEPVCLVKRQTTGIRCFCVLATSEMPDARCTGCFGSGFVLGYYQYFDPRNSDGRIRLRFEPWIDDAPILTDAGLDIESIKPNAWGLTIPAMKKRDLIVRFDASGNEDSRWEIISVSRNVLFNQQLGAQKLLLQKIRKTSIEYMIPVFRDTSMMPQIIQTGISSSIGIPPHSHTLVRNEKHPMYWQQITSVNAAHQHIVSWNPNSGHLEVSQELGHSHTLVY